MDGFELKDGLYVLKEYFLLCRFVLYDVIVNESTV